MELDVIKRYVTDSLTFSGVERKDMEVQVYEALHHLLTAMKLYDLMDAEDRAFVSEFVNLRMNHFLNVKISIKTKSQERKRNKEKKIIPPNPLLKEKEKTGKEEKPLSLKVGAKEAFYRECQARLGQYDEQQLADFYNWWSEENEKGQMRFQTERYWNIDNRLKRWVKNKYSAENTAAAMRLKRAKKQQAVAQERNEANDRLWQQYDDMKKGAVTHEEWLAMRNKKT